MSKQATESVLLSLNAVEIIELMREDQNSGISSSIEVIEKLLFELIRDETMGEDNNQLYMRYLVDVIELYKSLMAD